MADKKLTFVGTYRKPCETWIKGKLLYNIPVSGDIPEALECYRRCTNLWLVRNDSEDLHYELKNPKIVTVDDLRQLGYPVSENPHADHYVLFELSEMETNPKGSTDFAFIIEDFAKDKSKAKIINDFLRAKVANVEYSGTDRIEEILPKPIVDAPLNRLMVCNGMQMNFLDALFADDKKRLRQQRTTGPRDSKTVRFIDLFAGIGGIRKGFEIACEKFGYKTECVLTSEIKPHAIDVLSQNHPDELIDGDITQIDARDVPEFDFLLGGFPCQAFSAAGKRLGFEDTRGTLFFEVARILKERKPYGFILENVEGLVNHDKAHKADKIGRTLNVILQTLDELGYKVSWRVLNAKNFGVPQDRKRIYIVGTRTQKPCLDDFTDNRVTLSEILEHGKKTDDSPFIQKVLRHYTIKDLIGKSIKDKRGGDNNIHSWDIEYKGEVSADEKRLLNALLKERRKKKWAEEYGIDWMDGMPLMQSQIETFFPHPKLSEMLDALVEKRYLKFEHPKKKVGNERIQDVTLPKGYNIVAGKMSFEISKVLDPKDIAPTLVAMDMQHLFVADGEGLRRLTLREGLRLFGYPDGYKFDVSVENGYDLLGNTVVVPVIAAVAERVISIYNEEKCK